MAAVASLFATGLLIWFALLTALITMRVLSGDIHADGMLLHDGADSDVKPERVLAMAIFPAVLIAYAIMALQTDVTAAAHPSLPDVPNTLINLLTGGNGLYLAGKLARGT